MKIRMLCIECPTQYVDEMFLVEEQDEGLYQLSCTQGHKTNIWLQNHKFELLFDSGGLALLDGYPRESVSSITSALERFMEFYTRIIVLKRLAEQGPFRKVLQQSPFAIDPLEERKPLDETWKRIAKQSESQVGAFLFVYLLENGKPPPIVDELKMQSYKKRENKNFRNEVVHNGYAASQEQVLEYGEQIFNFIKTILYELRLTCTPEINRFTMGLQYKALLENHHQLSYPVQMDVRVIQTILSTLRAPDSGPQSFIEGLERLIADFSSVRPLVG